MIFFFFRIDVLAWTQSLGKQHDIIIVTICFDTANGIRGRKNKLIMSCEKKEETQKEEFLSRQL